MTTTHGGAREGAGRKKGSTTQKTQEIVAKALEGGITPLEVMLEAMREHYIIKDYDKAAAFAKDAAPYVHPRLAAVEHTGPDGGPVQVNISAIDAKLL